MMMQIRKTVRIPFWVTWLEAGRILFLGDICHDLAGKHKMDKGKNQKVNSSKSEPGALKIDNTTYFLNKGDTYL
jgi:hypothetical protein